MVEKLCINTVILGDNKTLFVPLDYNKQPVAIGFFVKNEGKFEGPIYADTVAEHIKGTTPVVAFRFKNKKSINDLIKFLQMYRDDVYKKKFTEVE